MTLHDLGTHQGTDQATVHDYLRRLEPYFEPFRENFFTLLEIGVAEGASIRTWHNYFLNALVVGVDNNPDCWMPNLNFPKVKILLGNAGSVGFWNAQELPNLHIVIDDGSHRCPDVICAFEMLWPKLNPGGLYIIEDVHANWLPANGIEWMPYFSGKLRLMNEDKDAVGRQNAVQNNIDFMHFTKGLIIIGKL